MVLFTVVTVVSYVSDRKLIQQWEKFTSSEEQLFLLRQDANRLSDIEHHLSTGSVRWDESWGQVGVELSKVPSLEPLARERFALLSEARGYLLAGRTAQANAILDGRQLDGVARELRDGLFAYEVNERNKLQNQLGDRLEGQGRLLDFDVLAVVLAVILILSASAFVYFHVQRLRKFDRDLVTARLEAERASRLKSAFLANMSHEIRTPLNGVLGLTRLLRETKLSGDQEEIVSSLEASGRTLLALVNDILDLSKIESGKIEVVKEPYDLTALIEDLEKAFRPTAERKKLKLIVENASMPIGLDGDVVKVRQVLQNLLSNAIKFTRQGEVILRFKRLGSVIRFEVQDTGIGIAEEALGRIFRPFEQADSSTSRHHGGSGLGLAICRHLVRAMDGRMDVESRYGEGSTFWFELPFEPALPPAVTISAPVSAPTPLPQERTLLLVEDNEVNARLVISFLRRRGFVVDLAEDGDRALEIAREKAYDLVLMDIHLPKKDGLETTRDLRAGVAGPAYQKTPIVALTASAIKGERERCLAAGMNDFLTKPIDLDLLEQTVRRFLGAPAVWSPVGATAGNVRRAPDLDEDLREELLNLFKKVTPPRLGQLRDAVAQGDWKSAGKVAHTMKSSAAQLGFFDLADVCKRLESKGFSGDSKGWAEEVGALEKACAEAVGQDLVIEKS